MSDFFYDSQIRRYLLQFIRIFSSLKIETGPDENGVTVQARVPVVYGDPSWMVAQTIKGNSENTMLPSPMMAAWIHSIDMAPERRRDPAYEGKINSIERNWKNGEYGTEVGDRYTIDRYMPVPYDLTMQLDIWTTTTTTKLQLLEQIFILFNPSIQLQQNSNFFDWTSIFEVELTETTWSNRGIPVGSEQERDVASLQFKVPIWINPPAKVKRIKIIEEIITNIHSASILSDNELSDPISCIGDTIAQIIVTPGNFKIGVGTNKLANNEIILLNQYGYADPTLSWIQLFEAYGNIVDNETILRLKLDPDIESDELDILGTVTVEPDSPNILIFDIDLQTLPSTISSGPITQIIDPHDDLPSSTLPPATTGQRYLLASDLTDGEEGAIPERDTTGPWEGMTANENDIIEYNGSNWFISFDSETEESEQHVINLNTMNQYRFTGTEWVFTYLGEYAPGYWRMENINAGKGFIEDGGGGDLSLCDISPCPTKSTGSV